MGSVDVYVSAGLSLSDWMLEADAGPFGWESLIDFCLRKTCLPEADLDREWLAPRLAGHYVPLAPGFVYPHVREPVLGDRCVVCFCRFQCPVKWPGDDRWWSGILSDSATEPPIKILVIRVGPDLPGHSLLFGGIAEMGKLLIGDDGLDSEQPESLGRVYTASAETFIEAVRAAFNDHPNAKIVVRDP